MFHLIDCSSRNNSYCTSLDSVQCGTIRGILKYKQKSNCQVIVTGGTEIGFETEKFSHFDGYRLNIDLNKCHDVYIKTQFTFIGKIKNGAPQWMDTLKNVFRLEGNHWNIFFNEN